MGKLHQQFIGAAIACVLLLGVRAASAQIATQVIAVTGQPAPDGNGSFSTFTNTPTLNDAGQAAFRANLSGTTGGSADDRGIFRGSGGTLTKIAREGQTVPNGNGSFSGFNLTAINGSGQAAFRAPLIGTSGGANDNSGIFVSAGGSPVQIVRKGQAAPNANGSFSLFDDPSFNGVGQTAFGASLTGTSGGTNDDEGIFRGNGAILTQIARAGQAAPDGNGSFDRFLPPAINDAGQVAFSAELVGGVGGYFENSGIFRGAGGSITQIARSDDPSPVPNGVLHRLSNPSMNAAGQVVFDSLLIDFMGQPVGAGIFLGAGGPITQIARTDQASPDANGTFSLFVDHSINDVGQTAFFARLGGTVGGTSDDSGIFRGAGGALTKIARKGQFSPNANGRFSGFTSAPALNEAGQVAFLATLSGTSSGTADDSGLFLFDDVLGLLQVSREGDALLGSTITTLAFISNAGTNGDERSGLNELGQVAYQFSLADGRSGIAVGGVSLEPPLAGDFDEDGAVDGDDLTRWRTNYGIGTTHTTGDADADGDADGADFLIWQRQVGLSNSAIAAAAVPEPATIALMATVASAVTVCRRKKKSR